MINNSNLQLNIRFSTECILQNIENIKWVLLIRPSVSSVILVVQTLTLTPYGIVPLFRIFGRGIQRSCIWYLGLKYHFLLRSACQDYFRRQMQHHIKISLHCSNSGKKAILQHWKIKQSFNNKHWLEKKNSVKVNGNASHH